MILKFKAHENMIKNIEIFLFMQEYENKPEFDKIIVETKSSIYEYKIEYQFGKWYIIV